MTSACAMTDTTERMVERMARGKIHASGVVNDCALQRLGELDKPRHAGGCARHAVANDDRHFRVDQHLGEFRKRRRISLRRNYLGWFRNSQRLGIADRIFLQLGVEREHDGRHRRRGRNLVGAHRRFSEVLQRGRLIVPLDEIAHDRGRVDGGVHPFGVCAALVGFDDVAAHGDHRNAVAPGVVQRHGGVLQADHAVANHGHRLALDLGVALRHVHRDLFVRAGEDFGFGIAAVVEHRLMQTAETRRAIHRQIFNVECLEHIDHEIAATGGLRHRVFHWRHVLGCGESRPGRRGLGAWLRQTGNRRVGGNRRGQRSSAGQRRSFEEIAACAIRHTGAFEHGRLPCVSAGTASAPQ